jgi:hypothetical protein
MDLVIIEVARLDKGILPKAKNASRLEVPRSKPIGSGVRKPRATQTGEPGGSGVCKHKTKKKGKTQHQQVPKASNYCLQVHNYPMMPKRNKVAYKCKAHASTGIPPSYVLRCNNLGKGVSTYVGNLPTYKLKDHYGFLRFCLLTWKAPSQIGDLKEGTILFCKHTPLVDHVGCLIADVHII